MTSTISGAGITTGTEALTGLQDLSNASAGQIKFPSTQNPSADPHTLDDYSEGTWTPTDASGAGLSFTVINSKYTKIGNMVTCSARITYPATASGANAAFTVPFTIGAMGGTLLLSNVAGGIAGYFGATLGNVAIYTLASVVVTNATMSGKEIDCTFTYLV